MIKLKIKKTLNKAAVWALVIGACLMLGFLSFGGMYALIPLCSLAATAFGLSVAYEGEIYMQNIKNSLKKLFKFNYLKDELAKKYLLNHFVPEKNGGNDAPNNDEVPPFFAMYEEQLRLLYQFQGKRLKKGSVGDFQQRQLKKRVRDMESWFALQLFHDANEDPNTLTSEERDLRAWLSKHGQQTSQQDFNKQNKYAKGAKIFSLVAGTFMTLAATYLLVDAFSVIPLFAGLSFAYWPLFIVPMSIMAGFAYGLLTYNAMTDMFMHNPLQKRLLKIKNDFKNGLTFKKVAVAILAVLLIGLAITLTICTAGTWWTIAKSARPLFAFMGKFPRFIMGLINPIINAISGIVFNLANTSESLELIDHGFTDEHAHHEHHKQSHGHDHEHKKKSNARLYERLTSFWEKYLKNENKLQALNPFRLLLKITILPLRFLLFLGHLISIGFTADRVPGMPKIASALLGAISEGFEDFHYFVPHTNHHCHHDNKTMFKEHLGAGHGHSHEADIPTWLLKIIFSPVYLLATLWDMSCSRWHKDKEKHLTFTQAWEKQNGIEPYEDVELQKHEMDVKDNRTSIPWLAHETIHRIERFKKTHLATSWIGKKCHEEKREALTALQTKLRQCATKEDVQKTVNDEIQQPNPSYKKHRFFNQGETETWRFVNHELLQNGACEMQR